MVALLNLILFFACPGTGYYGTPALITPKLYANAVLMVLNARIKILGGRTTYISTSVELPNSGIRFHFHPGSTDAELGPLDSRRTGHSSGVYNTRDENSDKIFNVA